MRSEAGRVAGAIVRVQATENATGSTADGSFTLRDIAGDTAVTVTAWAPGYYIGSTRATPGTRGAAITLSAHYTGDNPGYDWFSHEGALGSQSCGHCMPTHYAEWQSDAHSQAAVNPRFLTVYNGSDTAGNQSPRTRRVPHPDYGLITLPPDPAKPYYGPGYRLDFPDTAGNCATCHVPAAAARPAAEYAADPGEAAGIEKEGVFCEFCHKIGDVTLDPATRLPYPNRPGVLSMRLYRPSGGDDLFFGTFDDVTRRASYLPLQKESAFCAPCHFAVFWDTVVYNSYGEWLESPYSNPESGKTCQDCHMPATDDTHFVLPEKGGLERAPGRIFSHRMPGAADAELLQNTARLELAGRREGGTVLARVRVTNENAGHHMPTGHPARQVLLVLSARDSQGKELEHLGDQAVPEWGGEGLADRPGKAYAKVLEELWTGVWPSVAYWNPTTVREDTRLPALGADVTRYTFRAPAGPGPVTLEAELIYRRAFRQLAEQKKWDLRDVVMEHEESVVR
ncbi:MAG: hypothetical protein ACE5JM_14960 [Armatimonadota bacterium]